MQSEYRLKVLDKINDYEKRELWDIDVEDDPPSSVLLPNKVDYLRKKLSSKIKTFIANRMAIKFYEGLMKKGVFIIKEVKGLENYDALNGGAVLTCNHFSILDNYAVFYPIKKRLGRKHLYKVIREGNYTGFKGTYGFFFKNCNTLPLSSNKDTMKKFLSATGTLLGRGEKILIFPEQAMWWNYRKPRPLKDGAFKIAAKHFSPILPTFITMEDTDKLDADGFPIQAYTVWYLPAIYPKKEYSVKENIDYLKEENFKAWKKVYEDFYKIPLKYSE